jgi:hypothetical protein
MWAKAEAPSGNRFSRGISESACLWTPPSCGVLEGEAQKARGSVQWPPLKVRPNIPFPSIRTRSGSHTLGGGAGVNLLSQTGRGRGAVTFCVHTEDGIIHRTFPSRDPRQAVPVVVSLRACR